MTLSLTWRSDARRDSNPRQKPSYERGAPTCLYRDIYKAMVMDMDKAVEDIVATLKANPTHTHCLKSHVFLTAVSTSSVTYHWHVCDRLLYKEKVSLINHKIVCYLSRTIFLFDHYKPFYFCNLGMQGCFVINCRKGYLCDGCLCLITDVSVKSQKPPKLITKKCQEIQ